MQTHPGALGWLDGGYSRYNGTAARTAAGGIRTIIMKEERHSAIAELLKQAKGGKGAAVWEKLSPLLEDELRRLAGHCLQRERTGHTLQPTDLAHEVLLELHDDLAKQIEKDRSKPPPWIGENAAQLRGVLARAMRNSLTDYAKRRTARRRAERAKGELDRARGRRAVAESGTYESDAVRVTLMIDDVPFSTDVLDLNEAIEWLERAHPKSVDILERRFFHGQTVREIAGDLSVDIDVAENIVRTAIRRLRSKLIPEQRR
jgi:RNA polymerase sigma factor (sigma-70 family)